METIPRAKLSEDEWNRKNHVWKNADPTTRGDGRDFNGIDNYQQYLQSLNGTTPDFVKRELDTGGNYGPVDPSKIIPEPRLNANPGIKNDGTVGGSMPRELREYFSASNGMPVNSNDPRFGMYRDWVRRQDAPRKAEAPEWSQADADNFGEYLNSFNNGNTGDAIPKASSTQSMEQQFQKPEIQKMYNDIYQKLMSMTPEEQVAYARQMGVNI